MQFVSTRGGAATLGFSDAVLAGLASDGGLYVPDTWPQVSHAEIAGMLGLSEGTTKWHVSHARTVLRNAIAAEAMARTEKTVSR